MRLGVVDIGGGLRGIYAAGVFDCFLDTEIKFDFCIGFLPKAPMLVLCGGIKETKPCILFEYFPVIWSYLYLCKKRSSSTL